MTKQIRLGLIDTNRSKPPVLEYTSGGWRVWTAYKSPKLDVGTYIRLGQQGEMVRVVVRPDGTETEAKL